MNDQSLTKGEFPKLINIFLLFGECPNTHAEDKSTTKIINISLTPEEVNAYLEALAAANGALYHSICADLLGNLPNELWDAFLEQYLKVENPEMYRTFRQLREGL